MSSKLSLFYWNHLEQLLLTAPGLGWVAALLGFLTRDTQAGTSTILGLASRFLHPKSPVSVFGSVLPTLQALVQTSQQDPGSLSF